VDNGSTYVQIPLSAITYNTKDVTGRIKDVKDWNAYQNLIADVLNGMDKELETRINNSVNKEAEINVDALNAY